MPKKILITEDSPTVLNIMKEILESEGYNVVMAVDGQEALEKARKETPDLIVLDLMLPKIDGYRVCRMLKFDEKYKNIPIIMFTSRAQDSDKKLGQEVGADAYITKPMEPDAFLAQVKKLLGQ